MGKYVEFNTDLEKSIHRKLSGIRYGETLVIEISPSSKEEKDEINKAIRKTSNYNNLQLRVYWSKRNDFVKVTNEM